MSSSRAPLGRFDVISGRKNQRWKNQRPHDGTAARGFRFYVMPRGSSGVAGRRACRGAGLYGAARALAQGFQAGKRGRPRRTRDTLDAFRGCRSQPLCARSFSQASKTGLTQNCFLPIATGLGILPSLIQVRSVRVVTCRCCATARWSISSSIWSFRMRNTRSKASCLIRVTWTQRFAIVPGAVSCSPASPAP